jgi:hypothetical protein
MNFNLSATSAFPAVGNPYESAQSAVAFFAEQSQFFAVFRPKTTIRMKNKPNFYPP